MSDDAVAAMPPTGGVPQGFELLRRRQAEQWADTHRQLLRSKMASVSDSLHDQRSALTSLMGFIGLIQMDSRSDQVPGWVENVLEAAEHLRQLQDELRTVSLQPDGAPGPMLSVEPVALVRTLAAEIEHILAGQHTITVTHHHHPADPGQQPDSPPGAEADAAGWAGGTVGQRAALDSAAPPSGLDEPAEPIEVFVAAQFLEAVLFDLLVDGVATGPETGVEITTTSVLSEPVVSWRFTFAVGTPRLGLGGEPGAIPSVPVGASLGPTELLAHHLGTKIQLDDTSSARERAFALTCVSSKRLVSQE